MPLRRIGLRPSPAGLPLRGFPCGSVSTDLLKAIRQKRDALSERIVVSGSYVVLIILFVSIVLLFLYDCSLRQYCCSDIYYLLYRYYLLDRYILSDRYYLLYRLSFVLFCFVLIILFVVLIGLLSLVNLAQFSQGLYIFQ